MKKAVLVLSALFLSSIPCAAQGPLIPTNGPGPTMHTLEEFYQKLLINEQRLRACCTVKKNDPLRQANPGLETTRHLVRLAFGCSVNAVTRSSPLRWVNPVE